MKNWHREKESLEEAIGIAGVVAAYNLIPKDMPVNRWPKRLREFHRQQAQMEMLSEVPSPGDEARKARLDELRRHK